MTRISSLTFLISLFATAAVADTAAERDIKLTGEATIYGGEISDPVGASPTDAKLFLHLTGKPAQRMFELMKGSNEMHGGDCDDPDVTSRTKGDFTCMRDKQGYYCYLGIDIVRGKSIAASVC